MLRHVIKAAQAAIKGHHHYLKNNKSDENGCISKGKIRLIALTNW